MLKYKGSTRFISYLLLSALLSITFGSVIVTYTRQQSVPSRATWNKAISFVNERLEPGDKVTWYPEWAGEARLGLHDLPILILPHHGQVDLGTAKRLWVLGGFGYSGRKLASKKHLDPLQDLEMIHEKEIKVLGSGPVNISLLKVVGSHVYQSIYEDLSHSEIVSIHRYSLQENTHSPNLVYEECNFWALHGWHCSPKLERSRQRVLNCLNQPQSLRLKKRSRRRDLYTLDRRRWLPYVDCKLHPTQHISRDWRVIGESPRKCVVIHPHQNKEVQISWWIKPLKEGSQLWFQYGWADLSVRHPFRASRTKTLNVEISHSGQKLLKKSIKPQLGWNKKVIKLHKQTEDYGPISPIHLSYSAPQGVEDSTFCFTLDLRQ